MKVIFLDIDGVLNCSTTRQRSRGFLGIDPVKARIVKRLILETDARIVLSSVWRLHAESRREVELKVGPLLDATKNLGNVRRGEEVKEWLSRHPEVTIYAIVDDDSDFLEGQPLFQTSFETGLTEDIAAKIRRHLNTARAPS